MPAALEIDFHSTEWARIREYLNARVSTLSVANEGKNVPMEDTQFIRGQLRELRALLAMENPVAPKLPQPSIYT